jgi:diguanylate cyclase (GGDEF)-like protein
MFSLKKAPNIQHADATNSLFRILQLLLETCALHSVEFDIEERTAFQRALRDIGERLICVQDHQGLLILTGEANQTIQAYNRLIERFIRDVSNEKQLAVELLSQGLLRVCNASERSAQTLRQLERELARASQLQDMRELRTKLADCVATLCLEAEFQEAQHRELRERVSESGSLMEVRDQITGLGTLKSAESRIKEITAASHQGYVSAFFLKHLDVVNRRFGFSAGDEVIKRFATYLEKNLQGSDQLFRWRGPCFVVVADRYTSLEAVQADANKISLRGPEMEVESDGNTMLILLTAATTAFAIPRGQPRGVSELSTRIDEFAADQFKVIGRRASSG